MKKILTFVFCCLVLSASSFAQRAPISPKPISNANNNSGNAGKNFEHTEGQYQSINGVNIYFEMYGEGEPLLLIHDNNGSVESFNSQINFLSKKFKVIVVDSRGQGKSTLNKDSLSYEQMSDDYYLLLEKLELDSVNIFGWGDGGKIGLLLAINYPQKVKSLAILGTSLSGDTTALQSTAIAQINDDIKAAKDSIKAGNLEYKNVLRLLNLQINQYEIDPELLVNITAPVLIVSGDKDNVKLAHTVAIYEAIPNAQLSVMPGTTHQLPKEVTMQFNNMLLRFYTKSNPKPGTNKMNPEGDN